MRKLVFCLLFLATTICAKAQFEGGKKYISASLSGLSLSYSDSEKFCFGVDATAGYFVEDSWMIYGTAGYTHQDNYNFFKLAAGGRYYIKQNGLYLSLGGGFEHSNPNHNNVFVTPQVGYAFFISRTVTIEPSVYYDMSLNDFNNGSRVGFKVGFGIYL